MKPVLSAYVHVPFCSHRCGYCNFTLIAGRDDLVPRYLDALELEFRQILEHPRTVDTVYLGGGTPSHLPSDALRRFLSIVTTWLLPNADFEFSCEMNPLDCTPERLAILREAGVNRISLGGQSFSNRKLRILERNHTGDELIQSIGLCLESCSNLSLDLIFAAPDETLDHWKKDLNLAASLGVQHLSTYGLTIERGSAFFGRTNRNELQEVDVDTQLSMYEYTIDFLRTSDWDHYEVSSFARNGRRCRHNEAYWLGEPWWAFGPGAASFLPIDALGAPRDEQVTVPPSSKAFDQDPGTYVRQVNHRSTTTYIRKQLAGMSPIAERDLISREQWVRERVVFGLRRMEGVNLDELSQVWGSDVWPLFEPYLSQYMDRGWLTLEVGRQLKLTPAGLVISDGLWPNLLEANV